MEREELSNYMKQKWLEPKFRKKITSAISQSHRGRVLSEEWRNKISNSLKCKLLNDLELRNKYIGTLITSGLSTRFQKGLIPWNKGISFPEETRKKMSESFKGRPSSMKGKHLSQEIKNKLRLSHLGKPGVQGDKSHWWRGGVAFERRRPGFTKSLKRMIRKRDNLTCQECNYNEGQLGYSLHVHHIDYNKNNHKAENLISLCTSCHSKTNFRRREDWTNYYQMKMLERSY